MIYRYEKRMKRIGVLFAIIWQFHNIFRKSNVFHYWYVDYQSCHRFGGLPMDALPCDARFLTLSPILSSAFLLT